MTDTPFVPQCVPFLEEVDAEAARACVASGWVSSAGPDIDAFGAELGAWIDRPHVVPVASGTAALHLALLAAGVGPGDVVLVPSMTFVASVNPILYLGATPHFVDVEEATFNIDGPRAAEVVERLVAAGQPPRAVLAVHLYGHAADLDPLTATCERHGVTLVEDATEALGTRARGRHVGHHGASACYSFNGNKLITTGSGGAIACEDPALAARLRNLASQAKDPADPTRHVEMGFNYRMSNLQAALGRAQLSRIDAFVAAKHRIAARYAEGLADLPGLALNPEQPWCENVFWNYCVRIDPARAATDAAGAGAALRAAGCGSRPFWRPAHTFDYLAGYPSEPLPVTATLAAEGLVLPSSVGLTEGEQARVITALRAALQGR